MRLDSLDAGAAGRLGGSGGHEPAAADRSPRAESTGAASAATPRPVRPRRRPRRAGTAPPAPTPPPDSRRLPPAGAVHGGLRPMIPARANRLQLPLVLLLLVVLQFYVRPRLWGAAGEPRLPARSALMLFAMRSGPGARRVAGFLVGLVDGHAHPGPVRRGRAGAHAGRLPGRPGAGRCSSPTTCWSTPAFVAVGLWLRDLIVLVASGTEHRQLLTELTVYSPLQALTTARCSRCSC